jgi:hypothetical protein
VTRGARGILQRVHVELNQPEANLVDRVRSGVVGARHALLQELCQLDVLALCRF